MKAWRSIGLVALALAVGLVDGPAQGAGALADDVKLAPVALDCGRVDCTRGDITAARTAHERDAALLAQAMRSRATPIELFAAIDAHAESGAWLAHAACEAGAMTERERDDYVARLLDDAEHRKAALVRLAAAR